MRLANLFLLLLLLATPALAQKVVRFDNHDESIVFSALGEDIVIGGEHGSIVIQGNPHRVTIIGNHHDVVVSEAADMVIDGHHNDVSIERVGAIELTGDHNDVAVGASRPVVSDRGQNNDVVSAMGLSENENQSSSVIQETTEVVSSTRKLTLDGTSVTQTVDADGQDVFLNGSSNNLTLTGRPNSVTVNGALNKVTLETTSRIEVTGAQNTVRYRSGNPRIDNSGVGNVVTGP